MAELITMPKLSDTMEEGVLVTWFKKVGEQVKDGELIAEIETDKATMEFESYLEGEVLYIGVEEGATVVVDAPLIIIGAKGEDFTALLAANKQSTKEEKTPAVKSTETAPVVKADPVKAAPIQDSRLKVSPLAKKIAKEKGISLSQIQGTGPNNRIVKRDVESYKSSNIQSNFVGVEKYTEQPLSQMRKVIAKRLAESKFTAPHFYLTMDIDMDAAIESRKAIKSVLDIKISFNDMIIKACAKALKKHPKVNSSWLGDRIRYNEHINIGVAVAVDEGLLVPVVRFADGKRLSQISSEVKDYARKAKNKELQPKDWAGNTFTVSNLGMFGIEEFTAIINPPDAAILAIGAIKQVPVVKNSEIVAGNVMRVTLSCDHRVVDGVVGSQFLNTFKQYMENPSILLGEINI